MTNRNVVVIDDNSTNRRRFSSYLQTLKFQPIPYDKPPRSVDGVLNAVKSDGASYAIFDHHLFEGSYADFYGAQAVARLYDTHMVAPVLVTGYEEDDADTILRMYRNRIPVLLHPRKLGLKTLEAALELSFRETIEGVIPPEREACPAILTVEDVFGRDSTQKTVRVLVCQWSATVTIGFPLDLVPPEIRDEIQPGTLLRASVNVDAKKKEDIFFENIRLADERDVEFRIP